MTPEVKKALDLALEALATEAHEAYVKAKREIHIGGTL
jgi:hypothetical protein